MAVNNCSQSFPLSICLWTPIWHAPMCPNHNNKFYVVVICPTNQSMFYKLVHPKGLIKQPNLSTAERMKLKKLTQAVPSSPGRRVGLLVGSQARRARHPPPACRRAGPRPPASAPSSVGPWPPRPATPTAHAFPRPRTRPPAAPSTTTPTAPNPSAGACEQGVTNETEENGRGGVCVIWIRGSIVFFSCFFMNFFGIII